MEGYPVVRKSAERLDPLRVTLLPVDLPLPAHQQQRQSRATCVKFHGTVVGLSTVHDGHFCVH